MIINIIRHTSLATEHSRFLLSLDTLSASEQAASRNTDIQEPAIIRASVEFSGSGVEALTCVPVFEEALCFRAARWTGEVEGRAVAVVDGVVEVLVCVSLVWCSEGV